MATFAIALVFRDQYGPKGKHEKRELMLKRIPGHGWGLPGVEVTPEIAAKGIEPSLKRAIEREMTELVVIQGPESLCQIEHEGNTILVYRANFAGRPQRNLANPDESAVFADWSPYQLTTLAAKIIRMLPTKRSRRPSKDIVQAIGL